MTAATNVASSGVGAGAVGKRVTVCGGYDDSSRGKMRLLPALCCTSLSSNSSKGDSSSGDSSFRGSRSGCCHCCHCCCFCCLFLVVRNNNVPLLYCVAIGAVFAVSIAHYRVQYRALVSWLYSRNKPFTSSLPAKRSRDFIQSVLRALNLPATNEQHAWYAGSFPSGPSDVGV